MNKQWIFLDGEWREADDALLHRLTPGVRKRTGVFETLRVSGGHARDLKAHYFRLCRGLKYLSIPVPWTKKELALSIGILLDRAQKTGRLRVMVWRGGCSRAHWALVPGEYTPPGRAQYVRGVEVLIVPVRRKFGKKDGLFKSLDYEVYRKAFERARRQGCFEALLVGQEGRIIDGSRTNLVVMTDRGLVAPPAGYGTVDGLACRRILALARTAGLNIFRRPVFIKDLEAARGAWLTNALIGILPIRRCSGRARQ